MDGDVADAVAVLVLAAVLSPRCRTGAVRALTLAGPAALTARQLLRRYRMGGSGH